VFLTIPLHYKDFEKSLHLLKKRGGKHKDVADKVYQLLRELDVGCEVLKKLPRSNHGENRLKHCVKYKYSGNNYRLITIQTNRQVVFCFVGTHDAAEDWLHKNRGLEIGKVPGESLKSYIRSPSSDELIGPAPDSTEKNLIDRLTDDRQAQFLGVVQSLTKVVMEIGKLGKIVTPAEIKQLCDSIKHTQKRMFVHDVLSLLSANQINDAENRIDLEHGVIEPLETLSPEDLVEVPDGDEIRRIVVGTPAHEKWLNNFSQSGDYYDWLLFLHPEQRKVVDSDFPGPATLAGVSGSGKTCVAIKRAIRLVEENPESKVLLVTLNRSLAGLIRSLVEVAAPDIATRDRIEIQSFFELCQQLLNRFEPDNWKQYVDVSHKLEEHIDEVFREFYRCWFNNDSAKVLLPIHRSLIAQKVDAETYIREEFDWIRSGIVESKRLNYLSNEIVKREGRRVPFQKEWREKILTGLFKWEEKMRDTGVIDYLGLTTALSKHLNKLEPEYDYVVIDEAQDFGTTELAVLRKICKVGPNDLFLCSDIAQHVLPKKRSLSEAGILTQRRRNKIVRNYRNTREILKAAYEVLTNNLDETWVDDPDIEILDPAYSSRSSNKPVALRADSLEDEIAYARTLISGHLERHTEDRCCLAFAGYTIREIQAYGEKQGESVLLGNKEPLNAGLVYSDLEQTKGYEFDVVIILNCNKSNLPPIGTPPQEAYRHGCRLYVSMTRAKNELYLSYSGEPSEWLSKAKDSLAFMEWKDVEELDDVFRTELPQRLFQSESGDKENSMHGLHITGDEFLYTPEARGLSIDAIQKLSDLVDGQGRFQGTHRVRWKTVNQLLRDLQSNAPRVKNFFGPKVSKELADQLARADVRVRQS